MVICVFALSLYELVMLSGRELKRIVTGIKKEDLFGVFLDCTGIIGLLNYCNATNCNQMDSGSCNRGSPVPGTQKKKTKKVFFFYARNSPFELLVDGIRRRLRLKPVPGTKN